LNELKIVMVHNFMIAICASILNVAHMKMYLKSEAKKFG
jgi:hypothetical protein